MVEINQLLTNLQAQKDWAKAAVFTDKEVLLTTHNLPILPNELK